MDNVKEALQQALNNGWNDRLFQYYKDLIHVDAVRPQDEEGAEWKAIVAKLRLLAVSMEDKTPKPKPVTTPKAKEDDTEGSTRS